MGRLATRETVNNMMLIEMERLHGPLDVLKELSRCLDTEGVEACDIRDFVTALIFRCEALEIKLRTPTFAEDDLADLPVIGIT